MGRALTAQGLMALGLTVRWGNMAQIDTAPLTEAMVAMGAAWLEDMGRACTGEERMAEVCTGEGCMAGLGCRGCMAEVEVCMEVVCMAVAGCTAACLA
jgi:hypothetical protein